MSDSKRTRKPLPKKRAKFADCWKGDGVAAAREAGYSGSPEALAVRASENLDDPRVRARIEARGLRPPPRQRRGGKGAGRGGKDARIRRQMERDSAPTLKPPVPEHPSGHTLCSGCGATLNEREVNLASLRAMRDDSSALDRDKRAAITELERIDKQRRLEEAASSGGDPIDRLRAKVRAWLANEVRGRREKRDDGQQREDR